MRPLCLTPLLLMLLGCGGESRQLAEAGPSDSLRAEDSFEVLLPEGTDWKELQRGPVGNVENSFVLAVARPDLTLQLTVLVGPVPHDAQTMEAARAAWEKGFMKKASRKTSSESFKLGGLDAHKVIGELDAPDGKTYEIMGILIVANKRTYTVGATKQGVGVFEDPDVQQFVQSFKLIGG